jgi:GntR family carbon starvation induced transcriptional regulator
MNFMSNSVSAAAGTLAEQVYVAIKGDLLAGEWQAGSALLTRDLLDRYRCGVSPLREALARLIGEQFLDAASHRGVRVPVPSIVDVEDIYRTRIALEREALRLAIAAGDDVWEAAIVAAAHRLEHAPLPYKSQKPASGISDWEKRHRDFHASLVAAAPAPRLLRLIGQMVDQTERYRLLRLASVDKKKLRRDIVAEHHDLKERVIARDPRATDLLAEHLDRTRATVVEILRAKSGH